jgi:hypothetical protein
MQIAPLSQCSNVQLTQHRTWQVAHTQPPVRLIGSVGIVMMPSMTVMPVMA